MVKLLSTNASEKKIKFFQLWTIANKILKCAFNEQIQTKK